MEKKLFNVIAETFNIPVEQVFLESTSETIEKWDSLAHMNLIFAIEDEFGVIVSDEDLPHSMSVAKLLNILERKD